MAARATAKGVLPVLKSDASGFESAFERLVRRRDQDASDVERSVRKIIDRVRDGGDEELFACIAKFDGVKLAALEVTRDEWDAAMEEVDPADRAALGKASMRVREYHRRRIPSSWEMREEGGGFLSNRVRPLERVGIVVAGHQCQSQRGSAGNPAAHPADTEQV